MSKKFTLANMRDFAIEAWGPFGGSVVDKWVEFNDRYFGGKLRPVPLVITNTLPFGKFCSYDPGRHGRTITLNVPKNHEYLLADNCTLLHEMVHQYLFERGEDASHASEGWRREIMRLNKLITGKQIWAGRSISKRVVGEDGRLSKVVRINEPHPDGRESLVQAVIARWPHDGMGINLGSLGA
jgi:hypothetical protein